MFFFLRSSLSEEAKGNKDTLVPKTLDKKIAGEEKEVGLTVLNTSVAVL